MVGLTVREIAFCIEQKIDFIKMTTMIMMMTTMMTMRTIVISIIIMLMRMCNVLLYDNTSTINFLLRLLITMRSTSCYVHKYVSNFCSLIFAPDWTKMYI